MIGVYDSGVGGLSVWRELDALLPADVGLTYLADQAHVPYGLRSLTELRELAERCVRWEIDAGCDMVVVACNTACAAALPHLRRQFPNTPIVGMEPAIKPAAALTKTGVIGVTATSATFQSQLFASLVERYAGDASVLQRACSGWVDLVERGLVNSPEHDEVVAEHVLPLLDAGADVLVLGCTHFPFLEPNIRRVVDGWRGGHHGATPLQIIDPAPAVARQTLKVYQSLNGLARNLSPARTFFTTGDPERFERSAKWLLGREIECAKADLPAKPG